MVEITKEKAAELLETYLALEGLGLSKFGKSLAVKFFLANRGQFGAKTYEAMAFAVECAEDELDQLALEVML